MQVQMQLILVKQMLMMMLTPHGSQKNLTGNMRKMLMTMIIQLRGSMYLIRMHRNLCFTLTSDKFPMLSFLQN